MELLKTKYINPIEREYEGWIIARIEEYFLKINKKVRIFAVSPSDESAYPADEFLGFDCKIIGLQFKKASLGKMRVGQSCFDFSNVCWHLNSPSNQMPVIQKTEEIFYCLPTFTNRDYKYVALDHCLFWRPDLSMVGTTYWYSNPNVSEATGQVEQKAFRWGEFIERIYKCELGFLIKKDNLYTNIVKRKLIELAGLNDDRQPSQQNDNNSGGLYMLFIQL
ncbi:hypothetical protein GCM10027422_18350 [Hymenobacter arcticus]